ncbi:hypothetical protein GCM10027415_05230 [Humibacter ginsengisoli]
MTAAAALVVVAGLGAASVTLAIASGSTWLLALTSFLVPNLLVGVTMSLVGAIIATERPGQRLGWLMMAIGVAGVVPTFAAQYARYGLIADPGSLPGAATAAVVAGCAWPVANSLVLVGLPLLYPDGRALSRVWNGVGWMAAIGTAVWMAGLALSPGPITDVSGVENPLGVDAGWVAVLAPTGTILVIVAMFLAVVSLFLRYRHAQDRARSQIRVFLVAASLVVAGELGVPLAILAVGGTLDDWVFAVVEGVVEPALAIAVGVAVLRHHLHDIDTLVNRTAVYVVMTALVVTAYGLSVGYAALTLGIRGYVPQVLTTIAVALLFNPVRLRVQRGVDRLFYGRRHEPYYVLRLLGQRLADARSAEGVLSAVAETLREELRLPFVMVGTAGGVQAWAGRQAPVEHRCPLTFGETVVGELALSPRSRGESFAASELRIIEDYARQAGVALYAVQLSGELDGARSKLVNAVEDERRRLRRDLHDSIGAQLGSQAIALDAARTLIRSDPVRVEQILREMRKNAQSATEDLRGIINDLRPPVLDDRGLLEAVRQQSAPYRSAEFDVSVRLLGSLPPLAAATELALLRIAAEAVANAAKHSHGRTCTVTIAASANAVTLDVVDDGEGIPVEHPAGVGLASIRERAAELGGWSQIGPGEKRGARVHAYIPAGVIEP